MTQKEGSAKAVSSKKEPIEWNRMATIIATVVVLFFFTRSAPFPASTFWELAIARDFAPTSSSILFPESIALLISDSSISLLGLKAIYHIIYFLICSIMCIWIFRNKEPLPGLIGLSLFTFTMQAFMNLRTLLTMIFILGLLSLFDSKLLRNKPGLTFIPIMTAASWLGLNTPILLSLIFCNILLDKEYKLTGIVFAALGGLIFPEGLWATINSDSIFNWNFLPTSEMNILYVLAGIFLIVNIINLGRLSKQDLPHLAFYVITGFFALASSATTPIFVTMGFFLSIKLFSDQKPLPIQFQMGGLLAITTMVYLYLFINPFGIKLNPSVKNQLGKDLAPLMEEYIDRMPIETHNIGELTWKGLVSYDQNKIHQLLLKNDLILIRTSNSELRVIEPDRNFHKAVEF